MKHLRLRTALTFLGPVLALAATLGAEETGAPPVLRKAVVSLRPHVEVRGDYIPLPACLDAAALEPELQAEAATLFVGASPALHEVRRLRVSAIRAALRKLGPAAETIRLEGPEEIEVVRVVADDAGTGSSLESAWEQAIREYAGTRSDLAGAELVLQILDCRPALTWIGPDPLRVEELKPVDEATIGPKVQFAGVLVGGPDGPLTMQCTARVAAYRDVCVAAQPLRTGQVCRPANGLRRRVAIAEGECYVIDPEDLAGQKVLRTVAAGTPVTLGDLQPPPCVGAREEVTVVLIRGGARLQTRGTAQQDGAPGDTILVLNPTTKKTIKARVLGPGQVEAHP